MECTLCNKRGVSFGKSWCAQILTRMLIDSSPKNVTLFFRIYNSQSIRIVQRYCPQNIWLGEVFWQDYPEGLFQTLGHVYCSSYLCYDSFLQVIAFSFTPLLCLSVCQPPEPLPRIQVWASKVMFQLEWLKREYLQNSAWILHER